VAVTNRGGGHFVIDTKMFWTILIPALYYVSTHAAITVRRIRQSSHVSNFLLWKLHEIARELTIHNIHFHRVPHAATTEYIASLLLSLLFAQENRFFKTSLCLLEGEPEAAEKQWNQKTIKDGGGIRNVEEQLKNCDIKKRKENG
jgi:hypothetical protein